MKTPTRDVRPPFLNFAACYVQPVIFGGMCELSLFIHHPAFFFIFSRIGVEGRRLLCRVESRGGVGGTRYDTVALYCRNDAIFRARSARVVFWAQFFSSSFHDVFR